MTKKCTTTTHHSVCLVVPGDCVFGTAYPVSRTHVDGQPGYPLISARQAGQEVSAGWDATRWHYRRLELFGRLPESNKDADEDSEDHVQAKGHH